MEKKYEIPEAEEIRMRIEASILTSGGASGVVDDPGGSEEP